ncbi:MAG: hypothetical protein HRT42_14280, partial [Campylobacteraceae bacterium]|nr:hypothetical protein [Campylobacteraceae bacterium]
NLNNLPVTEIHSNITIEERDAIYTLGKNENIIIKKADKGGGIIIMDKSYYIRKVTDCLDNINVYKKLGKNIDRKIMHRIKNLTQKYRSCFDKNGKEIKYISNFDFKTANFYGLPKIHKSQIIKQEMKKCSKNYIKIDKDFDLQFRFITGGPMSPTSKLSELLDILLKPYYCIITSYIKDYTDF